MTKNWKKFYSWKKFEFFGSKIAIHLSLHLYEGRASSGRSLHPSKKNSQHFKNEISGFFFMGLFFLLDPDCHPPPFRGREQGGG